MPLLHLFVFLLVLSLLAKYLLPLLTEPFRTIFIVFAVLAICYWLLGLVGFVPRGGWGL